MTTPPRKHLPTTAFGVEIDEPVTGLQYLYYIDAPDASPDELAILAEIKAVAVLLVTPSDVTVQVCGDPTKGDASLMLAPKGTPASACWTVSARMWTRYANARDLAHDLATMLFAARAGGTK